MRKQGGKCNSMTLGTGRNLLVKLKNIRKIKSILPTQLLGKLSRQGSEHTLSLIKESVFNGVFFIVANIHPQIPRKNLTVYIYN